MFKYAFYCSVHSHFLAYLVADVIHSNIHVLSCYKRFHMMCDYLGFCCALAAAIPRKVLIIGTNKSIRPPWGVFNF